MNSEFNRQLPNHLSRAALAAHRILFAQGRIGPFSELHKAVIAQLPRPVIKSRQSPDRLDIIPSIDQPET